MTQLFAQPYDITANGFFFGSAEEYTEKVAQNRNAYGDDPVEGYEIQFIDGEAIDCALAKAWEVNQASLGAFFDAVDAWDDHDKRVFIIAVGEAGYTFDPETVAPDDFDVDIHYVESMRELAEQFVDEGLFGDIPEHLANYIDLDAIARDLAFDYTETYVASESLIYRAV
ncbi:hypothetical protein JANAI62_35760 [Jannaschia pagri]|uniref:Antirestriction protein (ArdA) n=1 Tax=Jannaschia pagri TaxID=2829797 RepID=A0ABQ4NRB7_9RHOB|nr:MULTISPECIES: antirestriction protein ArdA [unclassified Jannaschia]GIT93140.1 hypothetical protein JANAI61_35980 [Jannaschia sp. AI_61]GIT96953.1 hypothetical protein JANAI62_35760 [Jannaschia sp. AI_62]